ncbi:PHP domain-containing protein [Gracilibacillus massiliensis]|uniref:PHP domain-containing protein n=1 Tax=Gracilibacillus massiliensis TaxID=1564956 RepID=UPI00071CC8B2|nr:PHP domain-containing protein [Gracilibacillus massiliensis]
MTLDLHIHSTKSDGELTPKEIVDEATKAGLNMISFTDHDQIEGYHLAKPYAEQTGITLIPGIELNTDGMDGDLHILGYHFDPHHEEIVKHIAWRMKDRRQWAQKIVTQLKKMNYDIDFASCSKRAKGGIIVRTHIADELVSQGYFTNSKNAYTTLLQKGAPAFSERSSFTAKDAISLIHKAGGEAYLAHPGIYPSKLPIERIVSYGLDGIEVYHSKHTDQQITYWKNRAQEFGLKISGGSDHHGPNSRNPYPIGSVLIDAECIKQWNKEVSLS